MAIPIQLLLAAMAALAIGTFSAFRTVRAATFSQLEVDPNKFIAIAAPLGRGDHQLLILEQQSEKQACWSESGTNPIVVEPLLLQFDFTGICGRSTDSNGYSIRMADRDLGLHYRLSIIKRDGELVQFGISNRERNAPPIEIGRTNGTNSGFSKIVLGKSWRFTKRTFEGKTLGHVYFSSNLARLSWNSNSCNLKG